MAKKNKKVQKNLSAQEPTDVALEEKDDKTSDIALAEEKENSKEKDKQQKDNKPNDKAKDKKNKKVKKQSKTAKRIKETTSELKKVTWPSFGTVVKKTGVVLAVVIIFAVVLFGIDRLLSWLFELLTTSVSG